MGVSGNPINCLMTLPVVATFADSVPQKVVPMVAVISMGSPCCMLIGRSAGHMSRKCCASGVGSMVVVAWWVSSVWSLLPVVGRSARCPDVVLVAPPWTLASSLLACCLSLASCLSVAHAALLWALAAPGVDWLVGAWLLVRDPDVVLGAPPWALTSPFWRWRQILASSLTFGQCHRPCVAVCSTWPHSRQCMLCLWLM